MIDSEYGNLNKQCDDIQCKYGKGKMCCYFCELKSKCEDTCYIVSDGDKKELEKCSSRRR